MHGMLTPESVYENSSSSSYTTSTQNSPANEQLFAYPTPSPPIPQPQPSNMHIYQTNETSSDIYYSNNQIYHSFVPNPQAPVYYGFDYINYRPVQEVPTQAAELNAQGINNSQQSAQSPMQVSLGVYDQSSNYIGPCSSRTVCPPQNNILLPIRTRRGQYEDYQIEALKLRFEQKDRITLAERRELAAQINLTAEQIKIWFQNRRYKLRKDFKKSCGIQKTL